MFSIHNAQFCCPKFRDMLLDGEDADECTNEPVYVVESQVK